MAFCGACGAASEGRFCGVCGLPTEMPAAGVGPVPPAFAAPAVPAFGPPPDTQSFVQRGARASEPQAAQERPKSVPPPPLGARPAATGQGEVARPADATAMIHHHALRIAAGTTIEVGADDTFYGVVKEAGARQVAFALMTGVRKTPEPCEGYFVSRGVEGVELTHGGLELRDRKGVVGEVSVEGRMAFEIVDPVKLLTSDVPLDDEALGSLVTGSMADAVDRALREGLARGEYTMHELVSGDADVRVLDRCTSERIGPKLVKSHGVSTEVAELRIRGALASETDSALDAIPRPHPDSAASSDESTMEEPTFVERPEGSTALLYRAPGTLPAGTIVNVRADDNFLGLIRGEPPQQLPPGRHRVARALDAGLFVAQTGETTSFGASLGALKDLHGATAEVRVFGKVEVHVDDPIELVVGMGNPDAQSPGSGGARAPIVSFAPVDEVMSRVRTATTDVVRLVLRDGMSSGEWDLGGLADPAEVAELIRRAAKAYDGMATRVRGTTIEVLDLTVTTGEIAREGQALSREQAFSTVREQERQTERESVQPEGGTMHVRADEIVDPDDAERTMLPIPSMQYPPREAHKPKDTHSEPPDSVMPTAVSPPGYVQEVMQQLRAGLPAEPAGSPDPHAHEGPEGSEGAPEDGPRMTLPSARPPPIAPAVEAPALAAPAFVPPPPPPSPASQPIQPIRPMPAPVPVGGAHSSSAPPPDPWRDFAPVPEQPTNGGPPPQPPQPGYPIGANVLVMWSDGQRYPGQVHQTTPDHCLVVFTNGHQQWVPLDALTGA